MFQNLLALIMGLIGLILKPAPILLVAVGTGLVVLAIEHGVPWTIHTVKGWIGRNEASMRDDVAKIDAKIKGLFQKRKAVISTAPPANPVPPPPKP